MLNCFTVYVVKGPKLCPNWIVPVLTIYILIMTQVYFSFIPILAPFFFCLNNLYFNYVV